MIFSDTMTHYVAVIGAGAIGLSTAVQVQELDRSARVTVIADKFEQDTVSDGAAGLFRPTVDYIPGVPRDILKKWSQDSWSFYSGLAHSEEASKAGVGIVSGYQFFSKGKEEKDPLHREITYHCRDLQGKDFNIFPGTQKCSSGMFSTTLIVESRWFLPWLMKRFVKNGGLVEKRTVSSFRELARKYNVIVNCSGGRAKELTDDNKLEIIRGQMIRVKAPWIKHFMYVDHNCWIIPGKETVTIGGTRQVGDTREEISAQDSHDVWERACTYMPSLRKAVWQWQWVGMRPVREPIRVERERLQFGEKTIMVVHNYGHGGNGISLAWGCGKHAARLVHETLVQQNSKL
ncbi:hypothetical protein LSH36_35g05017 [Paralvinella palmiformis]|uniref:FAD dependent oxidoreductase domain-containing protein n=1 Tax=Paralvinella palmiformis TaxID=53620 RepID=A0AAD9K944_9ANNE|nr:hypothetical protein LSH36_35g05017 [Paralvinella palmiformis]